MLITNLLKKSVVGGLKVAAATVANWFKFTVADWCLNWNGFDDTALIIGDMLPDPRSWQNPGNWFRKLPFAFNVFGFEDNILSIVNTEAADELVDFGMPMLVLYKSLDLDAVSWNTNFFFDSSFFFINIWVRVVSTISLFFVDHVKSCEHRSSLFRE